MKYFSELKTVFIDFITGNFFEEWNKITPQIHIRKFLTINNLRTDVLLGVISDIHRVWIKPKDPMNVKNEPQHDTRPQGVSSLNFLMWTWGVISFHSSKESPVPKQNEIANIFHAWNMKNINSTCLPLLIKNSLFLVWEPWIF